MSDLPLTAGYHDWLSSIKARVQAAQTRAVLAVHAEQVQLYWEIGQSILQKQREEGWGSGVVRKLADDLRAALPDAKGLSYTNLRYMQRLAGEYPDWAICQRLVGKLPWGHVITLLDRVTTDNTRQWYAAEAIAHGWSRNVLAIQIESRLHERQGKAVTNFSATLPAPNSELATQAVKDPYIFDFLGIGAEAHERDIENALTQHMTRFLLELGAGFAFVGKQVLLTVGEQDFYIDLLFYHLKLRRYVVIELKAGEFKPEYAGQLNFYLSAVDGEMKHAADNPTLGILLCKRKNQVVAEYALRDIAKPMGIAEYRLTEAIPADLRGSLPTIEELEAALKESGDAVDE